MNWKYGDGRIYCEGENNELMAETTFVFKNNGEVDIDHTYVNPVLRGKGIAGEMMKVVAGYLKKKGIRTSATCSYANAWLKRHREAYPDLVSSGIDDEITVCKIDGKH